MEYPKFRKRIYSPSLGRPLKVGVLGFGNVAAATIQSHMDNRELIEAKTRRPIKWARVATRTPSRAQGCVPDDCIITDDPKELINDPSIDVILELTGDVAQGRTWVLGALSNGKDVVTANKALLARHGDEIMRLAEHEERKVLFEGAVAVSIPIIKTLRESAAANQISSLFGILNGTSNFVLTQMEVQGLDFADAVALAQRNGYAEADPTLDLSGEDAAHKLTLLASLCFGIPIDFSLVQFKGIQDVSMVDIGFSKRLGFTIKLIAQAIKRAHGISMEVRPVLVPMSSMLSQVSGSMNGITFKGDLMGSAFLYGSGAGGKQTSSAVLADLMELANSDDVFDHRGSYNMGFHHHYLARHEPTASGEFANAYYLRMTLDDRVGALAGVSEVLAQAQVSVKVMLQDAGVQGRSELVIITHDITRGQLTQALTALSDAAGADQVVATYPVLTSDG